MHMDSPILSPSETTKISKVLYVDDNPITRVVIAHLLQQEGVTCETASSGKEAISKIFNEPPLSTSAGESGGVANWIFPPTSTTTTTSTSKPSTPTSLPTTPFTTPSTTPFTSPPSTPLVTSSSFSKHQKYSLILMDIHMPEMDGFQTTSYIRAKEKELYNEEIRVPIVAISADAGISLKECLSWGMDGLCNLGGTTSFQEILLAVVRHWLQELQRSPRRSPPKIVPSPPEKEKPPDDEAHPRILIVEDNLINQHVVCKFLEKSGYANFDTAADGREALEFHSNHEYKLVLMDCEMPVMDGFECTTVIREREAQQNKPSVPIVAMTAYAMASDKEKCLACGMTDYIMKPIQRAVLIDMLRKYIPIK